MKPAYRQIEFGVCEGVATISLARAESLNAFTEIMMAELIDAFDHTDADDSVRAVVVTGQGRAFCAGADLSSGGDTFDAGLAGVTRPQDHRDHGGILALRIYESLKPVIAAINGPAIGVGATMTLPMDVRVASRSATFGFVFTRRGIVPEGCSSWFLPRVVGISQAQDWMLSGRVFDAEEAHSACLVSRVVEPAELLAQARALALDIAEHTSPVSVALTRRLLWAGLSAPSPRDAHLVESRLLFVRGQSPDVKEGVSSFLEKRPPEFPMSVSRDLNSLSGLHLPL